MILSNCARSSARFRLFSVFLIGLLSPSFFGFSQSPPRPFVTLQPEAGTLEIACFPDDMHPWTLEQTSDLSSGWFPMVDFLMRDSTYAATATGPRGFFRMRKIPSSGDNARIPLGSGGVALSLPAGQYGPSRNPYVEPRIPAVPKVVAGNTDPVPTCS